MLWEDWAYTAPSTGRISVKRGSFSYNVSQFSAYNAFDASKSEQDPSNHGAKSNLTTSGIITPINTQDSLDGNPTYPSPRACSF